MARFRLSGPAQDDVAAILETSETRWGRDARRRYARLLEAAMRKVADDPIGPSTRDQHELSSGLRSLHLSHAERAGADDRVGNPVHVVFFRIGDPGLIEIVRVLHERMEPGRHIDSEGDA